MRNNAELKRAGKAVFQANYWLCILVCLFPAIISGACSTISARLSRDQEFWSLSLNLVTLILTGPLLVGMNHVLLQLRRGERTEVSEFFRKAFGAGFGKYLGAYLLEVLFTFLWSLLLIIPGIVKAFSYSMVPFILNDAPDIPAREALRLSQRMMDGRKGQLFGLYLRYLGWAILSALTCGILAIFYVSPWSSCAIAEFYEDIKADWQQKQANL